LKPNQEQTPEAVAVACDVAAHACVCVPLEALLGLRRQPGPPAAPSVPANFLKHADEQSVTGLSAVYHAIHNHNLHGTDFTRWGVLGAPRFPGRTVMIPSMNRFFAEGAWGVSPHMVPHRSLHSLSGTISQALKIHGPNFGVGGGNGAADESAFVALALLDRQQLPGLWVVVTALEPETALDENGNGPPNRCVRALALALTPLCPGWRGLRLTLTMDASARPIHRDYFKLFRMVEQIGGQRERGRSVTQPLQHGARLTLAWAGELRNAECGMWNGKAHDLHSLPYSPSHIPQSAVHEVEMQR
jgi:hypothetical protein